MDNDVCPRSASKIRTVGYGVLFVSVLIALNLVINALLPGSYKDFLRQMTGQMASSLLLPFGATTFDGLLLTTNGFVMQIAVECTAMHFLTIFVAGVIAYPHHGAKYKLMGIAAGTTVLFLINVIRIAVLGLIGTYVPGAFDFLHIYLWQSLFALLVVAAWIVWVRKMMVDRPLVVKIGIALVTSVAGFAVLSSFMPAYLEALTVAARPIAGMLFDQAPSGLTVSGEIITLNAENLSASTRTISVNAYNQLIFLALMAASFRRGDGLKIIKRSLYGLGTIFLLLLGHVMLLILWVTHGVPAATMDVLDVTVRTCSLCVCIGLYILYAEILRMSRKNISIDREGGRINEKVVIAH